MNRSSASGPDAIRTHNATSSFLVFVALLLLPVDCTAEGAANRALFGDTETRLTAAEKSAILLHFTEHFTVSADGTTLEDAQCGNLAPATEIVDLNGDGVVEVFVLWGNACTSGGTGRSLTLFVRDAAGLYAPTLGFPAIAWTKLTTQPSGWPDLVFGGPGFCHGVWRYHAGRYEFHCNLPVEPGGCAQHGDVCAPGPKPVW